MHDERRAGTDPTAIEMEVVAGVPGWRDGSPTAEVRFLGRSPDGGRNLCLESAWAGEGRSQSRMHQVHGATVLAARVGLAGEGDALVTAEPGLALVVVTADCVPILVAGADQVAAIHAGWRGLVGGVIPAALAKLGDAKRLTAWIGPAIGPCCYEVGEEVAGPIVERSSESVRSAGRHGRPHLDLPLAAAIELERCGVGEIRRLSCCTACHPETLESYRRDGTASGRNRSLIWLRSAGVAQEGRPSPRDGGSASSAEPTRG